MASLTKGEIMTFPFQYTDLSNTKLRPCLVISDEINQDILLCQITSKNIKADKYSVEIRKEETKKGRSK